MFNHRKKRHSSETLEVKTKSIHGGYKHIPSLKDMLSDAGIPEKYLKSVQYPFLPFTTLKVHSNLLKSKYWNHLETQVEFVLNTFQWL